MSQREDKTLDSRPEQAQKAVRKPYQKPDLYDEQVFETSALNCGKVSPTQGTCHSFRKSS
jgi:hypothetical protein